MTNDPMGMRASDDERQQVVERLRAGIEDGRLTMEEYVERAGRAYQAVTYGDLAPLYADLPGLAPEQRKPAAAPAACAGLFASLPTALRVLWTIWLTAVSINVVVWALVSATGGHLAYPWPLWVAGPYGAVLFAVSVSVTQCRRGLRQAVR
ncbi:MAG TPA: DUF1707 domain-containing protein [Streptosporangiaceae bacterium]|nr:DUF1707 domain-containing protein [Streptosporangiaceae bacterium]